MEDTAEPQDGSLQEVQSLALRWSWAIHHDPERAQCLIDRHAELLPNFEPTAIEPFKSSLKLVQALHATFVRRDVATAEQWLAGMVAPTYAPHAAGFALVRAGIADLKGQPDEALLGEAERAIEAAAASGQNFDWERDQIHRMCEKAPAAAQ